MGQSNTQKMMCTLSHQIQMAEKDMERLLSDFRLYVQRRLLYKIPQHLRLVSVGMLNDRCFGVYFYYDGTISDKDRELTDQATVEVLSDIPPGYAVECKLNRVDYPDRIQPEGQWIVYSRYEEQSET